tara:strand:- start:905 stop:1015 length:111 start_codon:yes stop_codon:yes gene_type:complete
MLIFSIVRPDVADGPRQPEVATQVKSDIHIMFGAGA